MLDLNSLIENGNGPLKVGSEVIITSNTNSHNYAIGGKYTISQTPEMTRGAHGGGQDCYILTDNTGYTGNYIIPSNFRNISGSKVDKDKIIGELENILEFCKDYNFTAENNTDINKSYKIFNIFKELKSTKSDSEKIELISKYIS